MADPKQIWKGWALSYLFWVFFQLEKKIKFFFTFLFYLENAVNNKNGSQNVANELMVGLFSFNGIAHVNHDIKSQKKFA